MYNRTFISIAATSETTVGDLLTVIIPKMAAKSFPTENVTLYAVEDDIGTSITCGAGFLCECPRVHRGTILTWMGQSE